MNTYQTTVAKLHQLPEPLLQEVNHFIDQLILQNNQGLHFPKESDPDPETFSLMQLAETGFPEWHDPEEDIYNE
jgi:hypothetical protein